MSPPELWMKVDAALKQNLAVVHERAVEFIKGEKFNKLRSDDEVFKEKAAAFCGDVHETRDKLPLPVRGSAFCHVLGFIPVVCLSDHHRRAASHELPSIQKSKPHSDLAESDRNLTTNTLRMKVDAAMKQNLPAAHEGAIKADDMNKLRPEAEFLKENPVAFTGNVNDSSAFRQALGYLPGKGLACAAANAVVTVGSMGKSGVVQLAQSNALRSLKDKTVALCGNVSEKRDKLPLPLEHAFRHALYYIPGGGWVCAATDAVMMVGSMGKGGVNQIAQSPGSSLREQLVEVRTRMSELEEESDALKDMQMRVAELEKELDGLKDMRMKVSELENEADALKNQMNIAMSLLKKQYLNPRHEDIWLRSMNLRHFVKDDKTG